ncbi:MAG: HEAT repeat domain-containing protein [Myxococcales bacterium]
MLAAGLWIGFRLCVVPISPTARGSLEESANSGAKLGARPGDGRMVSLTAPPSTAAGPAVPAAPEVPITERVKPLMQDWRNAIIRKDAEMVMTLDRAFADHPREFLSALMASAETDPEERVRSFSTRVLGKLRAPESTESLRKLLADQSEYVRFNAAWALGQLADHSAVARLRRLQQRDPSPRVRQSAGQSLRAMEGG